MARRGGEVKKRVKNNVKPVTPKPEFFQVPQRREDKDKEEEDWGGNIDKILGRKISGTQEVKNREEQWDRETRGTEDREERSHSTSL